MTARKTVAVRALRLAVIAILLGACSVSGSPAPNPYAPRGSASPATSAAATIAGLPGSPVEGIVTAVDTEGLDKVTGFTLRTAGGASWEFEIRGLENATEFPPAHLVEHKATADPIRVHFHLDGLVLVADRIIDG